MPIFEYRCGECRKKFERIVLSPSAKEAPACPHCGSSRAEKLVSRFATASKGSGDDFGDDFGADEGLGEDDGDDFAPPGMGDENAWGGPGAGGDDEEEPGLGDDGGEDED